MQRVVVYSHDTFGIGNIRRMLAICEHLIHSVEGVSILLITGSPVIHSLRLPARLDYIKLPCLTRTDHDEYRAKTLNTTIDDVIDLRADLILAAVAHFHPDLVLVDKKPGGVKNELSQTLEFLKLNHPRTRIALVLRDILDSPSSVIRNWEKHSTAALIESFYDLVLVLGVPQIYDPRIEYRFPPAVATKVEFCGYIDKRSLRGAHNSVRSQLGIQEDERLILVTAGGGEDGHKLMTTYLAAVSRLKADLKLRSLIVTGPEMPEGERDCISAVAATNGNVLCRSFLDNMTDVIDAADVVVSMAGYNTVCELLSAHKRAVLVPRAEPVLEQSIRAERMADLGLFSVVQSGLLTPETLAAAVQRELDTDTMARPPAAYPDLNALARVTELTLRLTGSTTSDGAWSSEPHSVPYVYGGVLGKQVA